MKLKLDIDPDIVAMMAAEVAAGERAVTAAMREAGTGLKTAWRLQITGAGLGTRLANSIRSQNFPRSGESLDAAALVWSKAPVIVGAHDTGPLIRSKNGFWLAIPLPAAGKSLRGGRITPGEWERRRGLRLRFVYRRTGPSLLVAEGRLNTKGQAVVSRSKTGRGKVTAPIFLLVPQVKLPKRLDLARDADRALDSVPGLIVANWVEGPGSDRSGRSAVDLDRDMREFVQVCELFPVGRDGLGVGTQDRDDRSMVARSELPDMKIDDLVMLALDGCTHLGRKLLVLGQIVQQNRIRCRARDPMTSAG